MTEAVQNGADTVQVTLTDRVSGQGHRVETRYLLGCDGANSLVRSAIGAHMEDLKFQQRWLVVDVATSADLNQWQGVHQVCDPHRAATYMRIGESRYRWEFRLLPDETADDYSTMTALYPLIRPWVKDVAPQHLELVRVAEYTFRAQVANSWRRNNMFILGDAAHLTPPFIGQGMCAGLRDAMNLAWKLAGVVSGGCRRACSTPMSRSANPMRGHDPVCARDGYGDDRGRRGGQPAPPCGGSAPASDPRGAERIVDSTNARVAQH